MPTRPLFIASRILWRSMTSWFWRDAAGFALCSESAQTGAAASSPQNAIKAARFIRAPLSILPSGSWPYRYRNKSNEEEFPLAIGMIVTGFCKGDLKLIDERNSGRYE